MLTALMKLASSRVPYPCTESLVPDTCQVFMEMRDLKSLHSQKRLGTCWSCWSPSMASESRTSEPDGCPVVVLTMIASPCQHTQPFVRRSLACGQSETACVRVCRTCTVPTQPQGPSGGFPQAPRISPKPILSAPLKIRMGEVLACFLFSSVGIPSCDVEHGGIVARSSRTTPLTLLWCSAWIRHFSRFTQRSACPVRTCVPLRRHPAQERCLLHLST